MLYETTIPFMECYRSALGWLLECYRMLGILQLRGVQVRQGEMAVRVRVKWSIFYLLSVYKKIGRFEVSD